MICPARLASKMASIWLRRDQCFIKNISYFSVAYPLPMQHFVIKPNGFNEVRKKLTRMMVVINSLIASIVIFLNYRNDATGDSSGTWPYILIGFGIIYSFSVWNAMRRQKKIFESFRLTIGDESIVREQLYTPAITIEKQHVRDIVRYSTGQIVIDGGSKLNAIAVPSQIDNADELGRILSEIKPISEKTAKSWMPYVMLIGVLVGMLLMFVGLGAENKFISVFCGAGICIAMLYGFVVIQKSKNVDKRIKWTSYIFLIPFISILAVTIMKLMS
jgi:hypothetical protein